MKTSTDEKIFFAVVLFIAGFIVSINMNCDHTHCSRDGYREQGYQGQTRHSNWSVPVKSPVSCKTGNCSTRPEKDKWVRDTSESESNPIKVYVYQDGSVGLSPAAPTMGGAVGRTGFNPGVKIGF